MIVLSWTTQQMNGSDTLEHVHANADSHFTGHSSFRPGGERSANQLGDGRKKSSDCEAEKDVASAERVEDLGGSTERGGARPGERACERTTERREKRVAGSVHQRPDDENQTE
jgi:hypothetical protein